MAWLRWPFRRKLASAEPEGPAAEARAPQGGQLPRATPRAESAGPAVDADFASDFRRRAEGRILTPALGAWAGLGETAKLAVEVSRLPESFATRRWSADVPPPPNMLDDPLAFVAGLPSLASYADPLATPGEDGSVFSASLPVAASATTLREPPARRLPVRRSVSTTGPASRPAPLVTTPTGPRTATATARRVSDTADRPRGGQPGPVAAEPGEPPPASQGMQEPVGTDVAPQAAPEPGTKPGDLPLQHPPGGSPDMVERASFESSAPPLPESVEAATAAAAGEEAAAAPEPSTPVTVPVPSLPLAQARRATRDESTALSSREVPLTATRRATPTVSRTTEAPAATPESPQRTPGVPELAGEAASPPAAPIAPPEPELATGEEQATEPSGPPPPPGEDLPVARLLPVEPDAGQPIASDAGSEPIREPSAPQAEPRTPARRFVVGEPVDTTLPLSGGAQATPPGAPATPRRPGDVASIGAAEGRTAIPGVPGHGASPGERREVARGIPLAVARTVDRDVSTPPGSAPGETPPALADGPSARAGGTLEEAREAGAQQPGAVGIGDVPTAPGDMPLAMAPGGPGEARAAPGWERDDAAPTAALELAPVGAEPPIPVQALRSETLMTPAAQRMADAGGSAQPAMSPTQPQPAPETGRAAAAESTLPLARESHAGVPGSTPGMALGMAPGMALRSVAPDLEMGPDVPPGASGGAFGVVTVTPGNVSRTVEARRVEAAAGDGGEATAAEAGTPAAAAPPGEPGREADIESLTEKVWQRVRSKLLLERERRRGLP